LMLLTA